MRPAGWTDHLPSIHNLTPRLIEAHPIIPRPQIGYRWPPYTSGSSQCFWSSYFFTLSSDDITLLNLPLHIVYRYAGSITNVRRKISGQGWRRPYYVHWCVSGHGAHQPLFLMFKHLRDSTARPYTRHRLQRIGGSCSIFPKNMVYL